MARRGNGEGTIIRRTDGRWCAALSLEGGGRQFLYGRTRREVARKMDVAVANREQGLVVAGRRLRFGTVSYTHLTLPTKA